MSYKTFGIILIVSLIIQISFSFYYSSEIINQNNLLDETQTQLDIQKKLKQELEIQLAKLTSLENIQKQISEKNYIPIKTQVNLINP